MASSELRGSEDRELALRWLRCLWVIPDDCGGLERSLSEMHAHYRSIASGLGLDA